MPEVAPKTGAARARHVLFDVHPLDVEGNLGLTPDNLISNGDLTEFDNDGNPIGVSIGKVATPDGALIYAGTKPETTTVQNTAPLPVNQPSYLQNGPLLSGRYPLAADMVARIPKPPKPIVTKVTAERTGYPASTEASPMFIAFGWEMNGFHTPAGRATPFQVGQGQGVRAILPESIPQHITGIAIYLSMPGKATATDPGTLYRQRTVPVRKYMGGTYDLNGPFRGVEPEPAKNETMFGYPVAPQVWHTYNRSSEAGSVVQVAIQYSTVFGETPVGLLSPPWTISSDHTALQVWPKSPPAGVTGYKVWVVRNNRWYVAVDTLLGGAESFRPLSAPWNFQVVSGSTGEQPSQETDETGKPLPQPPPSRYLMAEADQVREDTSGVPPPDNPAGEPQVIGSTLPAPGPLYFRVANTVRGLEGPVSDYETVTLALGEMAQVFIPKPSNLIPNPEYTEVGSDGMPLGHEVIQHPDIISEVTENGLLIRSQASLTGELLLTSTAAFGIQSNLGGFYQVPVTLEDPEIGSWSGRLVTELEQLDASGNVIRTDVIGEATAPGSYLHSAQLLPAGASASDGRAGLTVAGISLDISAMAARIRQRVRNILDSVFNRTRTTIGSQVYQPYVATPVYHPPVIPPRTFTEGNEQAVLPPPWKPPKRQIPVPGGITMIEPAGPVALPGESQEVPDPDRLRATGTVLENLTFDTGTIPAPWTATTTGGATAAPDAVAAESGGYGLRCRKQSAGSVPASAYVSRSHDLPHPYFEGLSTRFRPQGGLPLGTFDFNELRRADGARYAWLRFANAPEMKRIEVTKAPSATGTMTMTLDGGTYGVEVRAAQQVETLNITAAPTSVADITINLGGTAHKVPVGGRRELKQLVIGSYSNHAQTMYINLNGVSHAVWLYAGAGPTYIAEAIRARTYNGYYVTGTGSTIWFHALTAGNKPAASVTTSTSYVAASWSTPTIGIAAETTSSLAAKLRTTPFAGWDVEGTGTQVKFYSRATGLRPSATFSPGTSGVAATFTTTTKGEQETIEQVAAKLRGMTVNNWTLSGSGTSVVLTANTPGDKGSISLNTIGTGVGATASTTRPGGNGDIVSMCKDEAGQEYQRRIIKNISMTQFTYVDMAVSGAGTNDASLNVWSATGSAAKKLVDRRINLDLTSYPASRVAVGVTAESANSLVWDFYVDSAKVTDRGETHFREHNARGRVINVLVGRYLPSQPLSQDLLLNGIRIPVLPGYSYSLGAIARFDNLPTTTVAKPLQVNAYRSDGEVMPLGEITDGATLTGSLPWAEYQKTVSIPPACYEIRIESRDISGGLFKIQELGCSLGPEVLRTHRYATYGTFRATLNKEVARRQGDIRIERRRKSLGTRVNVPANTTANMTYRSFNDSRFPQNDFFSNPDLVPDRAVCEVNGVLTGNGTSTPVVQVGSPYLEYVLMGGGYQLSTLLRPDRSELPGGIILTDVEEWTARPKVDVTRTFRNRVRRQKLASGVGHQPPCQIQVFSPDARVYLEEQWGPPNAMKIEALGWLLDVVLTEQPDFKRNKRTLRQLPEGEQFALYKGALATMEVIDARPFASPFG